MAYAHTLIGSQHELRRILTTAQMLAGPTFITLGCSMLFIILFIHCIKKVCVLSHNLHALFSTLLMAIVIVLRHRHCNGQSYTPSRSKTDAQIPTFDICFDIHPKLRCASFCVVLGRFGVEYKVDIGILNLFFDILTPVFYYFDVGSLYRIFKIFI